MREDDRAGGPSGALDRPEHALFHLHAHPISAVFIAKLRQPAEHVFGLRVRPCAFNAMMSSAVSATVTQGSSSTQRQPKPSITKSSQRAARRASLARATAPRQNRIIPIHRIARLRPMCGQNAAAYGQRSANFSRRLSIFRLMPQRIGQFLGANQAFVNELLPVTSASSSGVCGSGAVQRISPSGDCSATTKSTAALTIGQLAAA